MQYEVVQKKLIQFIEMWLSSIAIIRYIVNWKSLDIDVLAYQVFFRWYLHLVFIFKEASKELWLHILIWYVFWMTRYVKP